MAKKIRMRIRKSEKNIRFLITVLSTIAVLYIIDRLTYRGASFTLAPVFTMIVLTFNYGGTAAGLVSGVIVAGYSIYAAPNPVRAGVVAASFIIMVIHLVMLRRAVDNGDRLLAKLLDLDTYLAGSVYRWENLDDGERWEIIKAVHHKMAHIRTLTRGWHDLAMERERVLDDAYDDLAK